MLLSVAFIVNTYVPFAVGVPLIVVPDNDIPLYFPLDAVNAVPSNVTPVIAYVYVPDPLLAPVNALLYAVLYVPAVNVWAVNVNAFTVVLAVHVLFPSTVISFELLVNVLVPVQFFHVHPVDTVALIVVFAPLIKFPAPLTALIPVPFVNATLYTVTDLLPASESL